MTSKICKLKELMKQQKKNFVIGILCFFHEEQKQNIEGYRKIWDQLIAAENEESEYTIHAVWKESLDIPEEDRYWDIFGTKEGEEGTYALELSSFEEWANMYVDVPDKMTEAEFIAHCLYEMTFFGFTNESIQQVKDDINRREEDDEIALEFKSLEEVFEFESLLDSEEE